jgi:adenylate kinase
MARKLYIFLGAPGSGKGSLAARCAHDFGWYQLSTGNLCRYHIGARTPQGLEMDLAIKSGKLVSDDLIGGMVLDWLSHDTNDYAIVLDGFPRTVIQARLLDDYLKNQQKSSYAVTVVYFDIDDATVVDRIGARCVCSNKSCQAVYSCLPTSPCKPQKDMICDLCGSPLVRRVDDTKEAIQERLAVYKQHAAALLAFYRERSVPIITLDAKKQAAFVYQDFKQAVGINT